MLEFWPDYGSGPLWTHGAVISPSDVDVDPSLAERLIRWNAEYTEDKIPLDGLGDSRWMTEGRNLLAELRSETASRITIITTEPWWARAAVDSPSRKRSPGSGTLVSCFLGDRPGEFPRS